MILQVFGIPMNVPYEIVYLLTCANYPILHFVRFEVLTAAVMKSSIFWYTRPCNPFKVSRCFGGTRLLHLQGGRISEAGTLSATRFMLCSSILKMGVTCSSKTSVDFQRTKQSYNPGDNSPYYTRILFDEEQKVLW
jgi:hypothetical protein